MAEDQNSFAAVIVAAGRGLRAGGGVPKQWRPLAGQRMAEYQRKLKKIAEEKTEVKELARNIFLQE